MEPNVISKFEKWADEQIIIRNKRMASIMCELSERVPPELQMIIKRARVIEELFTSGSITITASSQPTLGREFQVENFDQLEASLNALKNSWEGVVNLWTQRLDDDGTLNIRFDAL